MSPLSSPCHCADSGQELVGDACSCRYGTCESLGQTGRTPSRLIPHLSLGTSSPRRGQESNGRWSRLDVLSRMILLPFPFSPPLRCRSSAPEGELSAVSRTYYTKRTTIATAWTPYDPRGMCPFSKKGFLYNTTFRVGPGENHKIALRAYWQKSIG